jgi:hypothetical protein
MRLECQETEDPRGNRRNGEKRLLISGPLANSLVADYDRAWRRRNPFSELQKMLGTAQIGLQGLDAFYQMLRRQMSISQGHSYVAMPSQCGNFG